MFLASLVAFGIAALFSTLELITRDYPRSFSLLWRRSWAVYVYAAIYGFLAALIVWLLDVLIAEDRLKLEGLGLSNSIVRAIWVGLSAKAFLHLRLYTITVNGQPFPVGVETIVQTFEPWLMNTIRLDHFDAVREFLKPYAARYTNVKEVRRLIKDNIPSDLPENQRKALITGSQKGANPVDLMDDYLQFLGRRNFERVFPL